MDEPKTLIVYYSRTGNTDRVARALAKELDCNIEELIDTRKRGGFSGYMRCGFDASFGRVTTLKPVRHDPADYDLIIVGTPVWSRSVSAPVRTYLQQNSGRFRELAFFLTHGGLGRSRVFEQMAELALKRPTATLGVTEHELDNAEFLGRVQDFAQQLLSGLETPWLETA